MVAGWVQYFGDAPVKCEFVKREQGCVCTACGRLLDCPNCERGVAECEGYWQAGDELEKALTALGITKERWKKMKEALGGYPTCNCDARREWLNKAGVHLQITANKLKQVLSDYYGKPR